MSVYLKLQEVREELSKLNLKKTGENKFSKYKYYELGDILPAITKLCREHKLCNVIKFTEDVAELIVVDSDKPDSQVSFTSTVAAAEMKGVQAIQRLGAEQTYLRRYLYMNAFEIVENDVIDETNNSKKKDNASKPKTTSTPAPKIEKVNANNIKALHTRLTAKGISDEDKKEYIKKKYNIDSSKDLDVYQYNEMMDYLAKKPDKKEEAK